ncbi:Serine-type D-Ala-D-Ala carboxypeptidase [Candidatus Jidaibacter acanthamoeba]|uniref:serine-type D-Ala-D-Ala carboxypeptidase n=1 Tax=Candidatus Jidaibacter acanthamoebae TaxID=86105 RepID=A0A0C1QIV5_9RICK|nr:D-alanyl-D-alanine carboxypeptidase family protein [Candidatus Jidaibacter acanthamoeba]KIE04138.1 Serine-type D-Ala-D-Ala carboxypeptidase [Candidatus Jidaibacter acanthamoeba]
MINLKTYIRYFVIIFSTILADNAAYAFETSAKQAYLMDFNTGTCLFDKNGEKRMVPSSMTKVMTAYVVFSNLKENNIDLHDEFLVSENAWRTGGTKMFVNLNSKVRVEDLLRGVIVQSGNDASKVLAEGIHGEESIFAESMNEHAKQIGMHRSNFKNASGLPHEEHYSTAKDIAVLAAAIVKDFPEYYNYFSEAEFKYNNIHQYNKNTLLGKKGVDGLKTGHTDAGGFGVVVSAKRDGRRLIAVVNGLNSEKERIREADKLLSYGFSNFFNKKLFSADEEVTVVDVWYGKQNELAAVAAKDIEVVLPKIIGKKNKQTTKVVYNSPIKAPIKKGDIIAQLRIEENNQVLFSTDLVAKEDVAQANILGRATQNIRYYWNKYIKSK